MKVNIIEEEALKVISHRKYFNGNDEEWKYKYYELWRYQLTWGFAYRIELTESRENGVFINMTIKPDYKDALIPTMENLGYGNIKEYAETIGIIYPYKNEDINFDEVIVDW